MKTRPLIILGSARKNSDTEQLAKILFETGHYTLVDLLEYPVEQYNYEERYSDKDKFMEIMEAVLAHNTIVFATPVYWYAMSGYMKIFFDRLTDIVSSRKETGRKLKGKRTFFITVGADDELPEGFEVPFRRTSEYLHMHYVAGFYCARNHLAGIVSLRQTAAAFIAALRE